MHRGAVDDTARLARREQGQACAHHDPRTGRPRPSDLVDRDFTARAPNRLWVADFTYVATWSGTVYVAFIIDVYSRRVLGWRAATTMTTELVLDTLEHAIWTRSQAGTEDLAGLVLHTDAGSVHLVRVHQQAHRGRRGCLGRFGGRRLRQRPG